jgi:hypothetical protein
MSNYTYGIEEIIVINSLKQSARLHFDQKDNDNILEHILGTLDYYMVYDDYQDFFAELYCEKTTDMG